MQMPFRFPGDEIAQFDVPQTKSTGPSTYLIGIKKGGSTMLAEIMRDLAPYTDREVFEFSKSAFSSGRSPSNAIEDVGGALRKNGYIYGVFRWLPENDLLRLSMLEAGSSARKAKVLTLIRDPRDVMVSLYYSDAKSHAGRKHVEANKKLNERKEQIAQMDLNDYVRLKTSSIFRHYLRTTQVLALENVTLLRYEDIIYDKPKLVRAVSEAMYCDVDDATIEAIAQKNDKMPDSEREAAHVRQVHPGNYLKKLRPETIDLLNNKFKVIINSFGYA